jgi:hypothetical protein
VPVGPSASAGKVSATTIAPIKLVFFSMSLISQNRKQIPSMLTGSEWSDRWPFHARRAKTHYKSGIHTM